MNIPWEHSTALTASAGSGADTAGSHVSKGMSKGPVWEQKSFITLRLEPTFSQSPGAVFTALITLTIH